MIRRNVLLFTFFLGLVIPTTSFSSQPKAVWDQISARAGGETLLLPLVMDGFSRALGGESVRNTVDALIADFLMKNPDLALPMQKAILKFSLLSPLYQAHLGFGPQLLGSELSLEEVKSRAEILAFKELLSMQSNNSIQLSSPVALHLYQVDVREDFDDGMNDTIYLYAIMTDGTVTWGKVTGQYPSIDEAQSVMLSAEDRILYPTPGISSKIPSTHLIVDYGIMESDGDDIAALQKLSSEILQIAKEVLMLVYPDYAALTEILARETQTLLSSILALNYDDRMAVGTVRMSTDEIAGMLNNQSYYEFSRTHKGTGFEFPFSSDWEYQVWFRLLK